MQFTSGRQSTPSCARLLRRGQGLRTREAKFSHTINDANHHIGQVTDASGGLSNMAFIAKSDLHPQGYLELDLASETGIASPNAVQISKIDGDLGQLSLVVAATQRDRLCLADMMRLRTTTTGIYKDLWRATSTHASIQDYSIQGVQKCLDVRLSLVPIAGYRNGIRYRSILAEKVLLNGDVVSGLLHFNDNDGNSLRRSIEVALVKQCQRLHAIETFCLARRRTRSRSRVYCRPLLSPLEEALDVGLEIALGLPLFGPLAPLAGVAVMQALDAPSGDLMDQTEHRACDAGVRVCVASSLDD